MNDISTPNPLMAEYSSTTKRVQTEAQQSDELGQKAFLELMITQMENQDPLSPQDNGEFIAQLAQFSSVESLDRLNNNFDSFASSFVSNQALQASSLVGRSVTVPSDRTQLDPGGVVSGVIDLPVHSSNVVLNIKDESGVLVDTIKLGSQPSGEHSIRWDGQNFEFNGESFPWQSRQENGQPPGRYIFEAIGNIDSKEQELQTSLSANVNSVTVGLNGALTLNLAGVGAVNLSDVKQFNE